MNAKVRVEITTRRGARSDSDVTVQLRVEDDASGEVLALVDYTANEWLALTTGLVTRKDGFISDHLERVGRKMVVRREDVPSEVTGYTRRNEAKTDAFTWAREQLQPGESVEVRSSNSGWKAIFRSWPEVSA